MPLLCTSPGRWSSSATPTLRHEQCPLLFSRMSQYVDTALKREGLCCSARSQREVLNSLMYESCDGRLLRAVKVLGTNTGGLNVGFLGDSTMFQIVEALYIDLYQSGVQLSFVTRSGEEEMRPELYRPDEACTLRSGARVKRGGSELHFRLSRGEACKTGKYVARSPHWEKCTHLPVLEFRVGPEPPGDTEDRRTAVRFWRLDTPTSKKDAPQECRGASFLGQRIAEVVRRSDIVFANLGLHFNSNRFKGGTYGAILGEIFQGFVAAERGHRQRCELNIVLRAI